MTGAADLERAYRRLLRWYPKTFRREHEAEILGVLMAGAKDGQRRPDLAECLDLLGSGLRMHLRPRVPRSDRTVLMAIRLMYLGAAVELATAITLVATVSDVKANLALANPGLTDAEWQAVGVRLGSTAVAAVIAVGFWLWMAWALGRGHRWARIAFAIFFGINTVSLLHGLAQGSAVYARADLAIGICLWSVELAVVALIVDTIAVSRSGAGRIPPRG